MATPRSGGGRGDDYYAKRKGPHGKWICRCGCGLEVMDPRRRTWYSQECIDRYLFASDPGWARKEIWKRDKGRCALCGVQCQSIHYSPDNHLLPKWEMDHRIPLVEGGENAETNLRTLCTDCHKGETKQLRGRMAQQTRDRKWKAEFSYDFTYRWILRRHISDSERVLVVCMLNPSTADGEVDDPTVRRTMAYALAWGYGTLIVVNLFSFRATDPDLLEEQKSLAVGALTDQYILGAAKVADLFLCAWGVHGVLRGRGLEVKLMLEDAGVELYCLGKTKWEHPKHPLYLKKTLVPVPWVPG